MDIAILCTSEAAQKNARAVFEALTNNGDQPECFYGSELREWLAFQFGNRDALIIFGSLTETVCAAAPLLAAGGYRPAILLLDTGATFCIPLIDGDDNAAETLAVLISESIRVCAGTAPCEARGI